jgi:hypothetical protein
MNHTITRFPFTGSLVINGVCPVTHKPWVVTVPEEAYDRWCAGEYIQRCMPFLTADQREMLMSGTSKEGWDILFPEEDAEGWDEVR